MNPGFKADGVLTLQVAPPRASYPDARAASFHSALQGALEGSLGPRSTAFVDEIPLTGSGGRSLLSRRSGDVEREAVVREATPAYFEVMGIPVLAGRSFDPHDDPSAPARCVISQSLAESLFGHEQPIGGRIWLGERAQLAEINRRRRRREAPRAG